MPRGSWAPALRRAGSPSAGRTAATARTGHHAARSSSLEPGRGLAWNPACDPTARPPMHCVVFSVEGATCSSNKAKVAAPLPPRRSYQYLGDSRGSWLPLRQLPGDAVCPDTVPGGREGSPASLSPPLCPTRLLPEARSRLCPTPTSLSGGCPCPSRHSPPPAARCAGPSWWGAATSSLQVTRAAGRGRASSPSPSRAASRGPVAGTPTRCPGGWCRGAGRGDRQE